MFALMLAAACSDDSFTDIQGDIERLVATPTQLFLEVGESETVDVAGVDGGGNPITATYEVTSEGAGIDVRRDSTFLPVYVDDSTLQVPPEAERFRFVVTGTDYGTTSFTVSANGQDIVIPVQVVPQNALEATISNTVPAIGEVITITAPAGTQFSATSVVTVPGDAQPFIVSIDPSGASMDILLPPNLTDAALTISDVTSTGAPGVAFTPTTSATVSTPEVPNFVGTISNLTPAVNEAVTLTLAPGSTFDPATTLLLGAGEPTVTDLTANSVTFIPAPGTFALLVANGIVLDELPEIPLSLPAPLTDTIAVSADIPTTAGTTDPATAPTLVTPGVDRSSVLFDKPPFDNGVAITDVWYKLVITEAGVYTVTLNWDIGSDIDMFLCPEPGAITGSCDFQAATGAHPEIGEFALDPGTYYVIADDFGFDAAGTTLQINVDHAAPAPPLIAKAKAATAAAVRKVRK